MPVSKINRRTILRGLGGFAIALPALEIMLPPRRAVAQSGGVPPRFVMFYAGSSTGGSGSGETHVIPETTGSDYVLPFALEPLAEHGVEDQVSTVTGLRIPWQQNGGSIPAAGRPVEFHGTTLGPQIAGTAAQPPRDGSPKGSTADQLVADLVAGDTLHRSLSYRVQPVSYVGTNGASGVRSRISWRQDGNDLVPIDPIVSPKLAYNSLFTGFVPTDPAEAAAAQALLERRKSVIDLVRGDTEKLLTRLGASDRITMERHFDEIRGLEKRLWAIPPDNDNCEMLPDPGEDPPIGGAIKEHNGEGQSYSTSEGYSDEEQRAEILCDLIHMAFVCDLSRVAAVRLTMCQSFMNMYPISGHTNDVHQLGHTWNAAGRLGVAEAVRWHVNHFARLASKLSETIELDGRSLLEHTPMVLLFEGGHGYDPESNNEWSPHSTERMVALISGGTAGGLVHGRHLATEGGHPASVVLSAMRATGYEGAFNEITSDVPALFAPP